FLRENYWSFFLICCSDEDIQLRCRGSTVDAVARQDRCLTKIRRNVRQVERSSGVYNHKIARGGETSVFFTVQNCADQLRILNRPTAAKAVERSAFQTEILWPDGECFHARRAVGSNRASSDKRVTGQGYFMEAVSAVDNPRFLRAENSERRRDPFEQGTIPDTENLKRSPSRIRQGTKQVKCGVHAELTPHLCDAGRRPVKKWRKHKTDSVIVQAAFDRFRHGGCVDTQGLKHVGAAGVRCRSTRTMLCHRQARPGNDKCRRRRDVEGFH